MQMKKNSKVKKHLLFFETTLVYLKTMYRLILQKMHIGVVKKLNNVFKSISFVVEVLREQVF